MIGHDGKEITLDISFKKGLKPVFCGQTHDPKFQGFTSK